MLEAKRYVPGSIHGDWLKVRLVIIVNYLLAHNAMNII